MQAWLTSQGFTLTQQDPNHTTVFAEASPAKIEAALGVTFARVTTSDGESTSAITAPSLPAVLAGSTLAINGLQPQLRLHHQDLAPEVITIPNNSIPVTAPKRCHGAVQCAGELHRQRANDRGHYGRHLLGLRLQRLLLDHRAQLNRGRFPDHDHRFRQRGDQQLRLRLRSHARCRNRQRHGSGGEGPAL